MARSKKSVDAVLAAAAAVASHGSPDSAARSHAPYLIAWSGGLDSTVLLHAMVRQHGAAQVHAVHVHHGLQACALAWVSHCADYAQTLGVSHETVHIPEPVPSRGNREQWARQWRYQLLGMLARRIGARAVLTAHHADDQLETLLMAIARGCGLDGLSGIAAVDRRAGALLLRPFFALERQTLADYAQQAALRWVDDPSNDDCGLTRNRVRHQVLPALHAALPGIARQWAHTSEHLQAARATLADLAHADWAQVSGQTQTDQPVYALSVPKLAALPPPRQAAVLRAWLRTLGHQPPEQRHLLECLRQLVTPGVAYAEQHLGHGWLVRDRERIWWCGTDALRPIAPHAWLPGLAPSLTLPGAGTLRLQAAAAGLDPAWLARQTLQIAPVPAQALLRRGPQRTRRTFKHLCQEVAIPRTLRASFPGMGCGDELWWTAPFGLNHGCHAPWSQPGVTFTWQVDDVRAAWCAR